MSHKIVVLSGAGISAESGLRTFRDSGGLWEGYDVQKVASISGWLADPDQVLRFYNMRRRQAAHAQPNAAHYAIARIQEHFDVQVVTQNVDDLHERAGSRRVLHLHGELSKARSSGDDEYVVEIGDAEIHIGDRCPNGYQLRPHIVWFGEEVPAIFEAAELVAEADELLVIGTSLEVYPAAGLVRLAGGSARVSVIDPAASDLAGSQKRWAVYPFPATVGIEHWLRDLNA